MLPVKGTLYIVGQKKPVADLNCTVVEYTSNHAPEDRYRINYEYDKRLSNFRVELRRDVPLLLQLDDGRQASVSVQAESSTPSGVILGVFRVKGDFTKAA